jgi:hypothetical protein
MSMDNGQKTFVSKNPSLGHSTSHLPVLDLTGKDKSPREALLEIGIVITDDQEAQYP